MLETTISNKEFGDVLPGWSVSEPVTHHILSAGTTGVGGASLTVEATDDSILAIDEDAVLEFKNLGDYSGVIESLSISGSPGQHGVAEVSVANPIFILGEEHAMPPVVDMRLSDIIAFYVNRAAPGVTVQYNASTNPVKSYRGWTGEVWQNLSDLAAINKVEITYDGSSVIVRDIINSEFDYERPDNITVPEFSFESQATAQRYPIVYQNQSSIIANNAVITNLSHNPAGYNNLEFWDILPPSSAVDPDNPIGAAFEDITLAEVNGISRYVQVTPANDGGGNWSVNIENRQLIPNLSNYAGTKISYGFSFVTANPGISGVTVPYTCVTRYFMVFYDADDVEISRTSVLSFSDMTTGTRSFTGGGVDVPDDTEYAVLVISTVGFAFDDSTSAPPASPPGYLWMITRAIRKVIVSNTDVAYNYFDGYSADAAWTGTPGNSASITPNQANRAIYDAYLDNNNVMEVEAGKTAEYVIESNSYVNEVYQPIMTRTVPVPVGTYHVIDSAGIPVGPEFVYFGGGVYVEAGDAGQIIFRLVGPSQEVTDNGGPYRLAVADGDQTYAQVKLAGSGVLTDPKTITIYTGADVRTVGDSEGPEVNSPFIVTENDAYSTATWVSSMLSGNQPMVRFSLDSDSLGFGMAPGKLFRFRDSLYRVIDSTVINGLIDVAAIHYNTLEIVDNMKWLAIPPIFTLSDLDAALAARELTTVRRADNQPILGNLI